MIGQQIVFSNSAGEFQLRQRKARSVPVKVDPEQFSAPGSWRVISAPASAEPGTIEIVVEKATEARR